MFNLNISSFPKKIIDNILYIVYYMAISYGFWLIIISMFNGYLKINSDYVRFLISGIFSFLTGITLWLTIPTYEIKIVKRNVFISGLINVLKNYGPLRFGEITNNYGFMLFQNNKVTLSYSEYSYIISSLISLDILTVKNYKELLNKVNQEDRFDYKFFDENIENIVLELKDKKINVDDLINRINNYLL